MFFQRIFHGLRASHFSLIFQPPDRASIAVRLSSASLISGVTLGVGGVALLGLGSLLFFREIEVNRHLQDRVLELEVQEKLARVLLPLENQTGEQEEAPVPAANTWTQGQNSEPRISEFVLEKEGESLSAKVTLIPANPGMAKGAILLVLEGEVPRLGRTTKETVPRKKYVLYPGYEARETLDEKQIAEAPKKTFEFARTLHTTADFELGKWLRPLAVTAYLYDREGNLIQTERKTLEIAE